METYDAQKTDTEARQASHNHGNLWVLIVSTAIVVAAFLLIYFRVLRRHATQRSGGLTANRPCGSRRFPATTSL